MKITTQSLRAAGVGSQFITRVQSLFGDGFTVTPAACMAIADELNWEWTWEILAMEYLLPDTPNDPENLNWHAFRDAAWPIRDEYYLAGKCSTQRQHAAWHRHQLKMASLFGQMAEGKPDVVGS